MRVLVNYQSKNHKSLLIILCYFEQSFTILSNPVLCRTKVNYSKQSCAILSYTKQSCSIVYNPWLS